MRPERLSRAELQAQTRERLLAAAETVVARHGYSGASLDLIAAEAGYSKGAIYSNFESKEAVFLELLRVYMERAMQDLERAIDVDPAGLPEALSRWLSSMQTDNHCLLLVTELQLLARRTPAFAEHYYALQERQTRALAGMIKRLFKAAGAPLPVSAVDLAGAMIALAHGLSLQLPQSDSGKPGKVADALMRVLLSQR